MMFPPSCHFQVCSCCMHIVYCKDFAKFCRMDAATLLSTDWLKWVPKVCFGNPHEANLYHLNSNIICGFVFSLPWISPLLAIELDWLKAITTSTKYTINQLPTWGAYIIRFFGWFMFWKRQQYSTHQKLRKIRRQQNPLIHRRFPNQNLENWVRAPFLDLKTLLISQDWKTMAMKTPFL